MTESVRPSTNKNQKKKEKDKPERRLLPRTRSVVLREGYILSPLSSRKVLHATEKIVAGNKAINDRLWAVQGHCIQVSNVKFKTKKKIQNKMSVILQVIQFESDGN